MNAIDIVSNQKSILTSFLYYLRNKGDIDDCLTPEHEYYRIVKKFIKKYSNELK